MTTAATTTITAPPVWQTDPARVHCIGILCGPTLALYSPGSHGGLHEEIEPVDPQDALLDLITVALGEKCASVWVLPPHLTDWSAAARALLAAPPDWLTVHPLTSDDTLAGLIVQRRRGGVPMGIYLLDQGDPWALAGHLAILTPRALADGLLRASHLLGMQLRFSPSYVGLQMLRQEAGRKPYAIPPLDEQSRELARLHRPTYVQWRHPQITPWLLAPVHDRPIRLYKYDRNSSFVASAGPVPVGAPVATRALVPNRPGVYQVAFHAPAAWADDLPGPFHLGEGAGEYPDAGETWAWGPQLRLAAAMGWQVEIRAGWYWPEQHDLFRAWRERLWAARLAAERIEGSAGRVTRAIIKRAGVAAIGRLNQHRTRAVVGLEEAEAEGRRILHYDVNEQGEWTGLAEVVADYGRTDLLRPDWWSTIIAGANERLFAMLYEAQARLSRPILGYVDAVYCLVPWPLAALAPERLGKWKLERDLALTHAEFGELAELSAAAAVKRLAAIARAQGAAEEADDGEDWISAG